ncbi:MAG TPA: PAS domain S-box protein [Burkholderiales bacterium]|nr:PAS domain S-box protein [Burkholderiales bacterium]
MSEEPRKDHNGDRFRLLVESVRDYAIFMLDPEGRVATWNAGAQRIKGYSAEEIIGRHFSTFYPPDAVAAQWPQQELEMAKRDGRFEDEGWRLRKDGTRFWANVVITALYARSGELRGFGKVTRDLTERRAHEERVRASEERFRMLVEGVKDYAIFMLDPQGRVVSWNAGAQRIKGYQPEEIIGQHFSVFYPPEALERGWPEYELSVARKDGRFEDEGWRVRKDKSLFWANVVVTPLHGDDGVLRGYSKVTRDMTERKHVEALEEGRRQMSEFLAMLGHELRNPLAPIRNAVHVMARKKLDPTASEWCRDVIDRQVSQLARLVDDLLDVTRITSGKIIVHKAPIDLNAAVERAVESTRPMLDARRHTLKVALADEPVIVEGDMVRLSQAILNLLNNAAKYTPEGGVISCTVKRESGNALVSVRDNGVGIPRDLLPKIFELFVQGDRSLDRSEGGLGVGLTLVDRLVRLHGGTVHAESGGPGMGSEFIVRLPLAAQTAPAGDQETLKAPEALESARRVLVVEDNRDAADTLAAAVRSWGHVVQVAYDGTSALDSSRDFRPDVALLDIGLPGLNGYQLADRLKALFGDDDILLIAVSGYAQEEDLERSLNAGIARHFAKPVDLELLRELLARPQPVPNGPGA